MSEKQVGRSRGLSSPAVPVSRGGTLSDNKGALSHSLAQITSFMSTSFPSRHSKRDDKSPRSNEVTQLKEEFERKIAAVVFCLEEKAEENIDLSYKLKALQESSKQREAEKDRVIEDLQKSLKAKEDECSQLEKKANDEVLNELNRRIQTITHCLNDMAEENLNLRTKVNQNAKAAAKALEEAASKSKTKKRSKTANDASQNSENRIQKTGSFPFAGGSPFSSHSSEQQHDNTSNSASFLSSLAASSSILTKGNSPVPSRNTSSPTPPASSTPPAAAPPTAANAKTTSQQPIQSSTQQPSTTSVSTNTSPVPITSPPPTTITTIITSPPPNRLPAEVADMKSEILADEFLKDADWLRKFNETYLVLPPQSQSLALLSDIIKQDKSRVESRVKLSLDDRIKELETQLTEHETNVTELKAKLEKETDRTGSLSDSVGEYEKKLKELEGRMWDNLNKEAQRRTEAESKAKRLKKKVDELQFLLDELKDDGSDEEEEEEEVAPQTQSEPSTTEEESK